MRSFGIPQSYRAIGSIYSALYYTPRYCSDNSVPSDELNIAPKKVKRNTSSSTEAVQRRQQGLQVDISKLMESLPKTDATGAAHAELSTSELERKVQQWEKMSPAELDELYKKYEVQEEEETKVLQDDSVMQMDVSLKSRGNSAIKVFWKDVNIREVEGHKGWYNVLVGGGPVKAFENTRPLVLPSEDYALACAREWAEQVGYVNKLIMPLTDMASGSMQVSPQAILPRIDYLMSFYQNDNCYFRAKDIEKEQDSLLEPIKLWFESTFDVPVPRIVGIGHPNISPIASAKVRDRIINMNLNQYQIVALCVVAQFTASLILPLAIFNNIVTLEDGLKINRAEEGHNVSTDGEIKGYHDIREVDVQVKICAAVMAFRMASHQTALQCAEVVRGLEE